MKAQTITDREKKWGPKELLNVWNKRWYGWKIVFFYNQWKKNVIPQCSLSRKYRKNDHPNHEKKEIVTYLKRIEINFEKKC